MSKAEEYYEELDWSKPFTRLTSTGITDNLDNVFEFAEQFAEHRIKQEREKWEKELEEKTKALKNLVTEVYRTKQHHSNRNLKSILERAESLTTK